jgi:23S rRNA (guanosine2251-2'-O)-methyltransferase
MKPSNSGKPSNEFVIGRIPVLECLRARKRKARRLFYLAQGTGLEEILAAAKAIPCEPRDRQTLDRLTDGQQHQGVVLDAYPMPLLSLDEWLGRVSRAGQPSVCALLLDSIEDPQNFGAIVRSATAFGAVGVLFGKDRAAPVSPAMLKAAAGAAEYIDLVQVTNLARGLAQLKEAGFWVSGLEASGDRLLWQADLRGRSLIVIGSEGRGIRRIIQEQCDFLVRIPIEGAITSLNASVSAAIALAEWKRQTAAEQG